MTTLADIQRRVGVTADGKWGPNTAVAIAAALGMEAESNFSSILAKVLAHEGGYVNHPKDPGGATNKGVTQKVYDAWRDKAGLPRQSVRSISADEVEGIYRRDYWDAVRGDDLPAGVDYAVFDFAVNSGINRASKYLQRVVGVPEDGKIGPATIAAVKSKSAAVVIDAICADRLAFMKRLSTWATFGRGWQRRVVGVRAVARAML